ncbi:MAG: site-2 protease family protein, partial [Saprospiraceae bacterium]|nr:site-2 protease family protein [Saprospiraceae bacterium]
MKGSLSLGRIAGIKLQVHWTFVLILAWVAFIEVNKGSGLNTILLSMAFVLTIFVCVILHELGHSLTAKRFGIETKKITLLPIGGVASLERMPEDPKQELQVAVAGPLVNVVIAFLLFWFVRPVGEYLQPDNIENLKSVSPDNFLFYLFSANVMLVVFNAIPAFPMDGGRVLRALLSFKLNRVRATEIAANLGQIIAVGFFFLGLFYNIILIFIAIFVYFGASGEYTMIRQISLLRDFVVSDAMMDKYTTLHPTQSMK